MSFEYKFTKINYTISGAVNPQSPDTMSFYADCWMTFKKDGSTGILNVTARYSDKNKDLSITINDSSKIFGIDQIENENLALEIKHSIRKIIERRLDGLISDMNLRKVR